MADPDPALVAELEAALAASRAQQADLRRSLLAVVALLDARSPDPTPGTFRH